MTRLFVDQREVSSPPPGIDTLEQVLRHVEQTQLGPESVIRQVNVDGLPLQAGQLQKSAPDAYGNISDRETIEIITGSVKDIAVESIEEAIAYLNRVGSVIPSIAASFQTSPGPAAFENLRQLYEGLYWLNLLHERLYSLFRIDAETNQVNGKSVTVLREGFLSNLRQMVEAHERGDFGLLADLLEFEIVPLVPDLRQLFVDLAQRAGMKP